MQSKYRFITFGANREWAFSKGNNVGRSLSKSINNRPDMFTVEDTVSFNDMLTKKPWQKVKCEAATVDLCRSSGRCGALNLEDKTVMSDDQSDTQDLIPTALDHHESRQTDFDGSPVGCAE